MAGTCTVVIPTYNEEGNIANMARTLRELYPDFDVVFMDDNSKDRSKELIEALGDPKVRIVVRDPEDRGLSASIFQGIAECTTDYFMVMDCDFQHPPSVLGPMYKELENGADMVIGNREDRFALGFIRWAGSWFFNILADVYLFRIGKSRTMDVMSGLYAGRCDVFVPVIKENWNNVERKGWKVLMDLLKYGPANLKIATIKYDFGKRTVGESHISPKVVVTTLHQMGTMGKFFSRVYDKLMCGD